MQILFSFGEEQMKKKKKKFTFCIMIVYTGQDSFSSLRLPILIVFIMHFLITNNADSTIDK